MKKLSLNRETLRHLDDGSMNRIRGGKPVSKDPDCTGGCTNDTDKLCDTYAICTVFTDDCTIPC